MKHPTRRLHCHSHNLSPSSFLHRHNLSPQSQSSMIIGGENSSTTHTHTRQCAYPLHKILNHFFSIVLPLNLYQKLLWIFPVPSRSLASGLDLGSSCLPLLERGRVESPKTSAKLKSVQSGLTNSIR